MNPPPASHSQANPPHDSPPNDGVSHGGSSHSGSSHGSPRHADVSHGPVAYQPTGPHAPPPTARPPRPVGWRVILAVLLAFAVALGVGVRFSTDLSSAAGYAAHSLGFGTRPAGGAANAGATTYWTCGMHPWIVLPEPGECPICQMDLVPLDPAKLSGSLTIDPIVVQNIGVRTQPVISGPLVKSVRTVGNVTYDETRLVDVNTKYSGWIEKLKVDSVGSPVKKGDVLFTVYSPELYSAQEEYLLAYKNAKTAAPDGKPPAGNPSAGSPPAGSPRDANPTAANPTAANPTAARPTLAKPTAAEPSAIERSNAQLLESARTRLKYFDLGDDQITALQQRGEPEKAIAVRSQASGVVIDKKATDGMHITPGMRLYQIADLSKVWVAATVFEQQLPFVRQGQAAEMSLAYLPGEAFVGKVVYVYPYLNQETRQATVRLEFDNAKGRLKPGMFAEVVLKNTLQAQATLAPQSAVMETGVRKVAIVSLGGGKFEPRDVTTGVTTDDGQIQVLGGLVPGEQVVTSGQFLIDSEAKMREALAKMVAGTSAAGQKATAQVAPAKTDELPATAAVSLNAVLGPYLAIADALASDSTADVAKHAGEIATAARQLAVETPSLDAQSVATAADTLADALAAGAGDLAAARKAFSTLSDALVPLVTQTGVPATFNGPAVSALHCPMFAGGTRWMQTADDVRNPYMGSRMITCSDQRTPLATTPVGKPLP